LGMAIPKDVTPWPSGAERRVAGISSFGFSGTNAHVILEEPPKKRATSRDSTHPVHLLLLSARNAAALSELAGRYVQHLDQAADLSMTDLCFTTNAGRSHFSQRVAFLAENIDQAKSKLSLVAAAQQSAGVLRGDVRGSTRPKIAFLFTGQGSQYPGMGYDL